MMGSAFAVFVLVFCFFRASAGPTPSDTAQLTDEEMDAMFNYNMLDGKHGEMEGTLARMLVQSRLAVLGPRLQSTLLKDVAAEAERSKVQLSLFVARTSKRYLQSCLAHTMLCPLADPTQLPVADALRDIRAFAAYSAAQYAVASKFASAAELFALDRRLGVKGYEAMCALMGKVPAGGNQDLKVQLAELDRLMKTMAAMRLVSNYTVEWQVGSVDAWAARKPVVLDVLVQAPAYAEFNPDTAIAVPGFYQDLALHIIEAHFDAYQIEVDRQVTLLDLRNGIHRSRCNLSRW